MKQQGRRVACAGSPQQRMHMLNARKFRYSAEDELLSIVLKYVCQYSSLSIVHSLLALPQVKTRHKTTLIWKNGATEIESMVYLETAISLNYC